MSIVKTFYPLLAGEGEREILWYATQSPYSTNDPKLFCDKRSESQYHYKHHPSNVSALQ